MTIALVLPLPASVAAALALPSSVAGALPAGDLHLTLAVFTGSRPDLVGIAASLAERCAPIVATLSGVGRFSGPDGDAFHASVDGPALPGLRTECECQAWSTLDRTHGFDPHVTLAYLAPDAPSPLTRLAPTPVTFTELALWDGETRTAFPFLGMNSTATLRCRAAPRRPAVGAATLRRRLERHREGSLPPRSRGRRGVPPAVRRARRRARHGLRSRDLPRRGRAPRDHAGHLSQRRAHLARTAAFVAPGAAPLPPLDRRPMDPAQISAQPVPLPQ